ncbi:MAG: alpha/beta hydrolase [Myxococcota bacterium]
MRMLPLLGLAGCVTLDGFAFNPVHCSTVGPSTCEEADSEWDAICLACDEPYDWSKDYPWFDGQLEPGMTIRPAAGVMQVSVPSDDGLATFDAYFVPSHGGVPELANTTIFYNHGNYAGIEHYAPRVRVLHELGYNVFVWDYRGYGKSLPDTAPSTAEFLADARQMRDFVDTVAPDPSRVIVYGYSLGALASVEASVAKPGCALFLEAPFTGASAIGEENTLVAFPETFLSDGSFDNIRKIAGYPGPLFAFVGSDDTRFPPSSVERIVDNAGGPSELWVLDGIRHGVSDIGVVEAGVAEYGARMAGFLEQTAPGCLAP